MAIDAKILESESADDAAIHRLRQKNRRIKPWESAKVFGEPTGQKKQGLEPPLVTQPSGHDDQGEINPQGISTAVEPRWEKQAGDLPPPGLTAQRAKHPGGEMPPGLQTLSAQEPVGELPSGSQNPRVEHPLGEAPIRKSTHPSSKRRHARSAQRAVHPLGNLSPGSVEHGGNTPEVSLSVDRDGGFDPRPFLPEDRRSRDWCEKGFGEFRIPHRLYEWLTCVTETRNELLVLSCMLRFSLGFHRPWCEAGYSFLSSWTGITDPGNVRKSIRRLITIGVIQKAREHNSMANTGTIYELPVVQAYLNYLRAGQGPSAQPSDRKSATEPRAEDASTGGCLTTGSNTQRAQNPPPCGQNNQGPGGEMTTKKENRNINTKKTLSQSASEYLQEYLAQIKAPTKRESESFFLDKLLENYDSPDVKLALDYIQTNGTLSTKEKCHSPLKYLGTAIEEVLPRATSRRANENFAFHHSAEETNASPPQEKAPALADFIATLSETERAKWIGIVTRELSVSGYLPPQKVLTGLAAERWFQQRSTAD